MDYIEIIGALVGILYLYLEYKASIYLWPVGVLMPLFYIYIFFVSRFYADMAFNVYYLGASVYGWIKWYRSTQKEDEPLVIAYTPVRLLLPLLSVFGLLFVVIWWILYHYTDSVAPIGDAFTTALSIIAMWMLAHKLIEQWWLWTVVNVVSCALYYWKGLYPTALLFVIYSIVPAFGYIQWKKQINTTDENISVTKL